MPGILDALTRRGIDWRQQSTDENEITICCLFCEDMGETPDYRFRLGFNLEKGSGHCFNCQWSSNHVFLKILQKLGEPSEIAYEEVSRAMGPKKPEPKPRLPLGFQKLENVSENDPLFGRARKYVKKRGITVRQLHEHEIGATVADDRYGYRIIFPVRRGKKLAGIVARDWTGTQEPRFLNSPNTRSAYNVNTEKYGTKMLVIAEGIVKALAIERALQYKVCCSALLGNQITDIQVQQLVPFKEVVLFPDPDREGLSGILSVAENIITQVGKVSVAWPVPMVQADEMEPDEIVKVIKSRLTYNPLLYTMIRNLMLKRA